MPIYYYHHYYHYYTNANKRIYNVLYVVTINFLAARLTNVHHHKTVTIVPTSQEQVNKQPTRTPLRGTAQF